MDDTCTYEQLDNGIHQILLHGSISDTRQEIDAMFHYLSEIYDDLSPDDHPRLLIDNSLSTNTPSVNYFSSRFREWSLKYSQRPAGSLAYVMPQNTLLVQLFAGLVNSLPRQGDRLRLFKPGEREGAIQWLLNN